nr:hypothetical protein 1 [Balneolaceae bacterium]
MAERMPNIPPSFSPTNEESNRVQEVTFGDGYSLVVGDGLNTLVARKSVNWNTLSYQEMATLLVFFRRHIDGRWFEYWMDEDPNRMRKFRVTSWTYSRVPDTTELWKMSAEFQEVFRAGDSP